MTEQELDKIIWEETRLRLSDEFDITEDDFDKIVNFCFENSNKSYTTLVAMPLKELKSAIKRTKTKIYDIDKLIEARRTFQGEPYQLFKEKEKRYD